MDKTYNGWTNYATWRVNLEMFDGCGEDLVESYGTAEGLADYLKESAEEMMELEGASGLALDYALAFLSDVNWHEIAENMLSDYGDND